jgi:tetratricopeptide (TPR) repeat protein
MKTKQLLSLTLILSTLLILPACATPLTSAADNGDLARIKQLLAQGANPNKVGSDYATPLSEAAWGGQFAIVEELLSRGANPNVYSLARNNHGKIQGRTFLAQPFATPIYWAAIKGYTNIVQILLQNGANQNNLPQWNPSETAKAQTVIQEAVHSYQARLAGLREQTAFHRRLNIINSEIETWEHNTRPQVLEGDTYYVKGRYHKAFATYLRVLNSYPPTVPMFFKVSNHLVYPKVLIQLFKVAHRLKSFPPGPERYRKEMVKALYYIKTAKSGKDYWSAQKHFLAAAKAAPWKPEPYEALGHVLETRKQYADAETFFGIYLLAAPSAPDARAIQDRIYVLEEEAKDRSGK